MAIRQTSAKFVVEVEAELDNNDVFVKLASRSDLVFTTWEGKYDEGNEVGFYELMPHESQKFQGNQDGTISPVKALGMVVGMETTSLDFTDTDPGVKE